MSYTNLLTHIVFSTKQRRPYLKDPELRSSAHAYLGKDHVHMQAHHRKRSFQEELVELLVKNGVEYDERYLWA